MEKLKVSFKINGEETVLYVAPNRTLLEMIREDLKLSGTKEGCGIGDCGACTVLLDGVPVNSCLVLAPEIDGKEVVTIEGLAQDGKLHPIQEAFLNENALQCGFCTPGMVISSYALLKRNENPSEDDIKEALSGNLCRCTGYTKIIEAVKKASSWLKGGK
ncbi:MAG: (2Fe-2S)-binding protein [Desulfobacterota bacterium]|nr:(2Fe-2S)-binding protein [Thermodesulfobacteriota bacterium]MDW8002344.1 (2Fe-2S)-binding protein [Deltaproteobacteria bacterium]